MLNKINFTDKENSYQVFGLNTSLKDLQLCSIINKFYKIDTKLLNTSKFENELSIFGDIIDNLKVLLIQNEYHNNQFIFPKLKVFEYVVILDDYEEDDLNLALSLEKIEEILYISKINQKNINTKDQALIYQFINLI